MAMIVANLRMTVRNREAIFWNLAFPAIFILIFGAVFGGGGTDSVAIGVAGGEGPLRAEVVGALEESEAFTIDEGARADILERLEEDDLDAVLVFPDPAAAGAPLELFSSESGGPNSQIARGSIRSILLDIVGSSTGFALNERTVSTLETSYIDFFVPGILGMSLMNSGIIGLSTAFVTYREKGILRRIKVTPFPLWKFILARIISSLLVALATSGILIGIGKLVYGLTVRGNPFLIVAVLAIGGLAFLAIGYAIAAFSRNAEVAASYSNLITFPMLFLSGVFFSVSTMPDWIRPVVRILPLGYLVDALRQPMMYGNGIGAVWTDLLVLMGVFAFFLLVAVRFFRWDATVT